MPHAGWRDAFGEMVERHPLPAAAAAVARLARMPYNLDAVTWSAENFDDTYASTWWPTTVPTLILSGAEDRIVTQNLRDANAFRGSNVIRRTIAGGAHFPWIERPLPVRDAFADLTASILAGTLGG